MNPGKNKGIQIIKKITGIFIIPLLCYGIMEICCQINNTSIFSSGYSTFQLYLRGLTFVLLLSLGVSINMHTGRFDFSTGAVMLISGVLSAKVSYSLGLGPIGMMVIACFTGIVVGLIIGLIYVISKLPPMIVGLGMALILEGIVAIISGGLKPIRFGTDSSYYQFAINPVCLVIISVLALSVMIILFHYTKFGNDYRALQTGQKISVNTGVNEKLNAVVCYTVAGGLFGVAGALSICSTNGTTPTINFTSIATMFACFLPLFFSGLISKYINKQIAILLSCMAYEFLQIGFGSIMFVNAGFTLEIRSLVESIILVLFLIYINNENKIVEIVMLKEFRKRLQERRKLKEVEEAI